jgi:hypothetical protein
VTENEKPRDFDLQIWLNITTFMSSFVLVIGFLYLLVRGVVEGLYHTLNLTYVYVFIEIVILFVLRITMQNLAWKHFQSGNKLLTIGFALIMVFASLLIIGIIIYPFLSSIISLNW